jgi:Putative beta-lactamase-inhibitor-like, PepSY-like
VGRWLSGKNGGLKANFHAFALKSKTFLGILRFPDTQKPVNYCLLKPTTTMRYLIFFLAAYFFLTSCGLVQPPETAVKNFQAMYPNAEKTSWNIDRNGRYEVNYKLNGTSYRSDFEQDGHWVETETSVKWKDLPAATQMAFMEEDKKKDIIEIELVEHHEKGRFYDIEYKISDGKQDIMITPAGKVLGTDRH